jgi:hypothetical protein
MRITVEVPEDLLQEARRIAREKGVPLESLVETALRQVVEAEQTQREPFRLRKHPFGGQGLHPDLVDADWSEVRRRVYGRRGG